MFVVGKSYKLRTFDSFSEEEVEKLRSYHLPTQYFHNYGKTVKIEEIFNDEGEIPLGASDGLYYPHFAFESILPIKLDKILEEQ